jgi:GT2 family glycosyltransferase
MSDAMPGSSSGSEPRIAVLVLNWNGLSDTLACLESLTQVTSPPLHIFVIDNHSSESPEPLFDRFRQVIPLRNSSNLGYAGGNNVGFHHACTAGFDYIWVLNNDTRVAPDALIKMAEALDRDPGLGAVSNLILYMSDAEERVWYAGGILEQGLSRHRGMGWLRSQLSSESGTDFLSGCSFLIRRQVIEQVGGFDERYFCYAEDVDLSVRICQHGWRLGYVPDAVVWHSVSASSGHLSATKIYYKYRNKLLFLKKHRFPLRSMLRWYVRSLRYAVSLWLKHKRPDLSMDMLIALWHGTLNHSGKRCP